MADLVLQRLKGRPLVFEMTMQSAGRDVQCDRHALSAVLLAAVGTQYVSKPLHEKSITPILPDGHRQRVSQNRPKCALIPPQRQSEILRIQRKTRALGSKVDRTGEQERIHFPMRRFSEGKGDAAQRDA